MSSGEFENSDHVKLALDFGNRLVAKFSLPCVRMWLTPCHDRIATVPTLCTTASSNGWRPGGMTREAVMLALATRSPYLESLTDVRTDPRFLERAAGKVLIGLPIRSKTEPHGYVEAYAATPPTFATAAEIERDVTEFSIHLESTCLAARPKGVSRGTILIAEGDPALRAFAHKTLAAQGFSVREAADGEAALATVDRGVPDVILLDWLLPGVDGRTTARRLAEDPVTKLIPVVMSHSDAAMREVAFEAGARDFITKPFESAELLRCIEQALRWRLRTTQGAHRKVHDGGAARPARTNPVASSALLRAMREARARKYPEALALFTSEAEACEVAKRYDEAARAYRGASAVALHLGEADLSNKFTRLCGKMYLCWAETTSDLGAIDEAYVRAAKCFLQAGNPGLVSKSIDMAASFDVGPAPDGRASKGPGALL